MRYSRAAGVEAAPMQGETVIYSPSRSKFCLLNETAAYIWDLLENACTPDEITNDIVANFDGVERAQAERDVEEALAQLLDLEVISTSGVE